MANVYDMSDTWNDGATTFTSIKMNVTDTASSASSLLMDLQVGGSSKFKVEKDGDVTLGAPASFVAITNGSRSINLSAGGVTSGGIRHISGSSLTFLAGSGYGPTSVANGLLNGGAGSFIGWQAGPYSFSSLTPDLALYRDAANTLAQRNSTNAQTFNLYNTYTDASNYERYSIKWDGNVVKLGLRVLEQAVILGLFYLNGVQQLFWSLILRKLGLAETSRGHREAWQILFFQKIVLHPQE
jgi:hypothetical protein